MVVQTFIDYCARITDFMLVKALIAVSVTVLIALIGQNYLAYQVLFILVVVDFITGFMAAIRNKKLSSRRASRSIQKIILYILILLSAHQLLRLSDYLAWFEGFIAIFLATTEMLSIIENANKLGVSIPKWVTEKLEQYNHQ